MGPSLDGIGGHRGEEFLIARLMDPAKQTIEFSNLFGGKPNLMPHSGLKKNEAKSIAKYLLTLPEPEDGFFIGVHTNESDSDEPGKKIDSPATTLGRELFLENGCAACHTTYDNDPRFGPSLAGISKRRTRESIEKLLGGKFKNKLMKKQASIMDPQEIKCITDFLLTL